MCSASRGRRALFGLHLAVALFSSAALCVGGGPATKHQPAFSAVVRDSQGAPLAGAAVSLFKASWTEKPLAAARTDRDGAFSLSGVKPGAYAVSIAKPGYQSSTFRVNIPPEKPGIEFVIKRSGVEGDTDNWSVDNVLRSSSDRKIIFRAKPGAGGTGDDPARKGGGAAVRSGNVQLAAVRPFAAGSDVFSDLVGAGLSARFAYIEPLGRNSSYVVTGMLTTGADRAYYVKNMLNYRIADSHQVQVSVAYNRNPSASKAAEKGAAPLPSAMEKQIINTITPIQNISVGFQDYFQIFEPLTLVYGFDITCQDSSGFSNRSTSISPRFQFMFTPVEDMSFRFMMNSERPTYSNTLPLKEGQSVNLPGPAPFSGPLGGVQGPGSLRHYEAGLSFLIDSKTSMEISSFLDEVAGSGYAFVAVLKNPDSSSVRLPATPGRFNDSKGFRFNVSRRWTPAISTSVLYIYGSGARFDPGGQTSSGIVGQEMFDRKYFNILSATVNAHIPKSGTSLAAVYRHAPGSVVTPIDLYSDYYDVSGKSLNLFVKQQLPLSDRAGGRWEALLDMRNILSQGVRVYHTVTGDLILVKAPRTIRGGISYRF